MLTLSTPRFLRARRGASFTEYAVLSGVLGAVAIGSVLTLGGEAVQGTEAGTTALQDAFYVAEAPAPVAPPSGGVEGEGGSGEGAEAPPDPFAGCIAQIEALGGQAEFGFIHYTFGDDPPQVATGFDGFGTLAVLGADAVATWDTPTSGRLGGRVTSSDGIVEFADYDRVFLCDAGGEVFPPPPPVPALFGWHQGAMTDIPLGGGYDLWSDTSATANASAMETVGPSGVGSVARTVPTSLQINASEPFVRSSSLAFSVGDGSRTVATFFSTPVEDATFRVASFNSFTTSDGVRHRDTITIRGITENGDIVYPTTTASFVADNGSGNFLGNTLTCTGACASALFTFGEPVALIHFTHNGTPAVVSGGATTLTYAQIWVSDIAGKVVLE